MGKHGTGKCNSNGELLLALCSEFELIVTNTMFKQKNTTKPSTISHRASFEQQMDSALAQWEEKESATPDDEWAALQQVIYNTAKTYIGKPDRKHQYWFDLNDQTKLTRECCKPEAPVPPLQHTKMPADCYKNAPVHWSKTGWIGWHRSCRELLTETTMDRMKCGDPRRRDLFTWNQELWQDGVITSRSYSTSLAT